MLHCQRCCQYLGSPLLSRVDPCLACNRKVTGSCIFSFPVLERARIHQTGCVFFGGEASPDKFEVPSMRQAIQRKKEHLWSLTRSSSREVNIRVPFFPVVYFSRNKNTNQKRNGTSWHLAGGPSSAGRPEIRFASKGIQKGRWVSDQAPTALPGPAHLRDAPQKEITPGVKKQLNWTR